MRVERDVVVIDDPDARAVMRAVARHNCRELVRTHMVDRVSHFARRIAELGRNPADVMIVVLDVDDPAGGALAEVLMPAHDWQAYRDRGEVPFARGLAEREPIQMFLREYDAQAAGDLAAIAGVAVLVMDFGTTEVFKLEEIVGG